MRSRRIAASDEPQTVRRVSHPKSACLMPSQTLKDTWEKIIETIFLALIATTLGTLLAIPVSFLAARNLMEQSSGPSGQPDRCVAPLGGAGWLVRIRPRGQWGVSLGSHRLVGNCRRWRSAGSIVACACGWPCRPVMRLSLVASRSGAPARLLRSDPGELPLAWRRWPAWAQAWARMLTPPGPTIWSFLSNFIFVLGDTSGHAAARRRRPGWTGCFRFDERLVSESGWSSASLPGGRKVLTLALPGAPGQSGSA